jgi:hypothetical protein
MLRDPRVSLCVDDQTPPFSFVVIEGLVKINQGEMLVKIRPTKIIAQKDMVGW